MADEVRLREYVAKLLGVWERRKRLAILVFAAAFAICATVTFVLPNTYQSGATVIADRQSTPFHDGPDPRVPIWVPKIPIRTRLDQIIHQFDLYPTERTKLSADVLVERMMRDIKVEPVSNFGNTIVFTIKYQGPDPTTVARVANTLARYLVDENLNHPRSVQFRIMEPAIPATTPSAPKRPRLLLLSLALSTGLAIGFVLLAEYFDTSVHKR
jgi:uncharacterized protein involved in exopolysaccharide biosynthesis